MYKCPSLAHTYNKKCNVRHSRHYSNQHISFLGHDCVTTQLTPMHIIRAFGIGVRRGDRPPLDFDYSSTPYSSEDGGGSIPLPRIFRPSYGSDYRKGSSLPCSAYLLYIVCPACLPSCLSCKTETL